MITELVNAKGGDGWSQDPSMEVVWIAIHPLLYWHLIPASAMCSICWFIDVSPGAELQWLNN